MPARFVTGFIHREGEIVHVIARAVNDWSADLAKIAGRDEAFEPTRNRIDVFRNGEPVGDPGEPRRNGAQETLGIKSRISNRSSLLNLRTASTSAQRRLGRLFDQVGRARRLFKVWIFSGHL